VEHQMPFGSLLLRAHIGKALKMDKIIYKPFESFRLPEMEKRKKSIWHPMAF
jgi:hypothetical protein